MLLHSNQPLGFYVAWALCEGWKAAWEPSSLGGLIRSVKAWWLAPRRGLPCPRADAPRWAWWTHLGVAWLLSIDSHIANPWEGVGFTLIMRKLTVNRMRSVLLKCKLEFWVEWEKKGRIPSQYPFPVCILPSSIHAAFQHYFCERRSIGYTG